MTETARLAIEAARVVNGDTARVIEMMWLPFQLLYCELVESKEIPALMDLPEEQKLRYWRMTSDVEAKGVSVIIKRIWICQALYCYDLILETV